MTDDAGRALEAVLKLTALEERTSELKHSLDRIENKLESLIDRLARVEASYEHLSRSSRRREIPDDPRTETGRSRDTLAGGFLTISSEE